MNRCLESVSNQDYGDFECICINDASSDSSPNTIREWAAKDSRFSIVENEENIGLGLTRNKGMALASGSYILFLDSDDWLELTTLSLLSQKISDDRPDLIFFDHYLAYNEEDIVESRQSLLLKKLVNPDYQYNISDYVKLFHVAWNKAYNTEFLLNTGVKYPKGSYEDFVVSYKLLSLTRNVDVLVDHLYYYYQRGGTKKYSPTKKPSSVDHFIVFSRYREILEFLTGSKQKEEYPAVFTKMVNQLNAILFNRIEKGRRIEFFKSSKQIIKELKPADLHYYGIKDKVLFCGFYYGNYFLLKLINKSYSVYNFLIHKTVH